MTSTVPGWPERAALRLSAWLIVRADHLPSVQGRRAGHWLATTATSLYLTLRVRREYPAGSNDEKEGN